MFRRYSILIVLAALASPSIAPAADRAIQELQRDVALLQQMVKDLQQAQDKKFADLQPIVQQAVDSASHANTAIAGIQTSLQQSLRTQEEKVVAPVVGLSTRMDNLTTELRTTEQNITDLSGQLTKILAMLDDMNKQIKVIQTPPQAPPPTLDSGGAPQPNAGMPTAAVPNGGQVQAPANPCSPSMSSVDTYQNALKDYQGGNNDFALTELGDYLRCFANTPYSPNAQYYIGMIHYAKGDFETARNDFDKVLEHYPETANHYTDARFYKGMSLLKSNDRNGAVTEFRDLILKHPRDPAATQACKQLQDLGMHCPTAAAPAGKKSVKKD